ncbi:Dolichyl-phosphate-mannose-protein mannosyltransferase-domain-containing protein [Umbelopsis sp. PMI_123]|nr:Dolichyl-phosphate-mannose-protein mannosyltransferase-domain-containing protein [Umbelopsis sp. PMI_123]
MAYALRYRKSQGTKGLDLAPALYEPHEDTFDYNEAGYKKYKPRYYRANVFQSKSEVTVLSLVTLLGLATRIWIVDSIDTSVLGEFNMSYGVNQYLNGKFFLDRNPPLATMMYTLAAKCFGYEGQQRMMYMGQPFTDFPYVQLRLISATFGALQVPIAYITLKLMGQKSLTGLVAAALLIFENGAISQHRHILTTAPLGFFAATSIMMWVNFHNHQNNPYCLKWWTWQTLTGICIGCAISTNWTGVLLLPFFWASNARQMWCLLGDRMNPITSIVKEVSSRIWSMMIVPLGVYLLCFQLHFYILYRSGDHDLLLSPELRSSINEFRIGSSQNDVAYGSKVYLRHLNSHVGYLHSHEHFWIDGSAQQQVTAYPYQDLNNGWIFQKIDSLWNGTQSTEWVEDKQKVRLEHFSTLRKLHSHDKHAPISQDLSEVTAFGDIFTQDSNDHWTVEIVDHEPDDATSKERLKVLSTKFRLKHSRGCYLTAHEVKLPDYAKGHFEVACRKDAKLKVSTWLVENSIHPKLKMVETDRVEYKMMNFYQKLLEVHGLMRNYDNIIPNADPVRIEPTQPHQWLLKGETMQLWNEEAGHQVATAINPIVTWAGFIVTTAYVLFAVLNSLLSKRGIEWPSLIRSQGNTEWKAYQTFPPKEFYLQSFGFLFAAVGSTTVLGYALPINMYLSDSFLSVYFMILVIAVGFEVATVRLPLSMRLLLCLVVLGASCYTFVGLIPVTYGKPWTKTQCELSSFNFDCQAYPIPSVSSQSKQEKQTAYVDIFGYTYVIDYQPDEYESFSKKAREIKLNVWNAKTRGTKVKERYIGVQSTPSPNYSQVKVRRQELRSQMTAMYLAKHPTEETNGIKEDNTANMDASQRMIKRESDPEQTDVSDVDNSEEEIILQQLYQQSSQVPSQDGISYEPSQTQLQLEEENTGSQEQQTVTRETESHKEETQKQPEEHRKEEQQTVTRETESHKEETQKQPEEHRKEEQQVVKEERQFNEITQEVPPTLDTQPTHQPHEGQPVTEEHRIEVQQVVKEESQFNEIIQEVQSTLDTQPTHQPHEGQPVPEEQPF